MPEGMPGAHALSVQFGMASTHLILLSGGIESATLLSLWRAHQPDCLFIDYGQRAARQELRAATALCAASGTTLTRLDMADLGEGFRRDQTQKRHVPLPHRNLLIVAVALSWAAQSGQRHLGLALNREDLTAYPSAARGFLSAMQGVSDQLDRVSLDTPLADYDKSRIIRLGMELGVDFSLTYSCLLARDAPCGHCPQCCHRATAFARAGLVDSALA
jgi:7-cyano-7-deazaguanine synthase